MVRGECMILGIQGEQDMHPIKYKVVKMKILFIVPIFMVLLIGCSSYYTARQFSSRDKFYEDFNSFARNKNMKVTLTNDSSFITNEGTMISNDSLILLFQYQKEVIKTIPQNKIKNIKDIYDANSNHTTKILLKDGEELSEKGVRYLPDSSIQFTINKVLNINKSIPINRVKEVYYNRHWLGIVPGFFAGIPLGAILVTAKIIPSSVPEGNPPHATYDSGDAAVIAVPLGIIIGGVVGWFVGFDYTYIFNP